MLRDDTITIMAYNVGFTPEAANQLRALRATDRAKIADHCLRILSINPTLESKARIKRLREGTYPPYRLRVDDHRVFYDVDEAKQTVMIYGVVSKTEANNWLGTFTREVESDENGNDGGGAEKSTGTGS